MTLHVLSIIVTIVTLVIASWYDLKYREIPERLWIPAFIVSLVVIVLSGIDFLLVAISLIPALILLILMLLGMIGGADFIAMLLIGITSPYLNLLPISFITLFYSALIPSFITIYNAIVNVTMYRTVIKRLNCRPRTKFFMLFLGKPMRISEFMRSKFIYPLTLMRCLNDLEIECRTSFNVNEDHREHIKSLAVCLDRGYIRYDDMIMVTPALPHIVFITIGYVLALLTPTEIIYIIFSLLARLLRVA